VDVWLRYHELGGLGDEGDWRDVVLIMIIVVVSVRLMFKFLVFRMVRVRLRTVRLRCIMSVHVV